MHRHLILGTAGHVDHGKTALVKALTGIDCDTHKQEKERGITINLGFAHLDLPGGETVGIVDVPGHRDFVHTMVSGASGIDFAVLVVAADSGIMPQTREHVLIMELLGIRAGIVALTKTDIVEPDVLEMAREEVAEFVKGTFLQGRPIVAVSSRTGAGIEDLKKAIADTASAVPTRPAGEVFRMFIDRIFTVSGFGTVVTGSVIGGELHKEDTAYLLPGGKELRVRRLERYGLPVESVTAGDRASINLVGLDKAEFERGMIVADRPLKSTLMVDAQLRLFADSRPLGLWSQAVFLLGAYEAQARVHLIDKDRVYGGDTALVQIHLPAPCVACAGDRFVIRSTSSDVTLGGGEIIDAVPLHHRRRRAELIEALSSIAQGKLPQLIAAEIVKRQGPCTHLELADALNVAPGEVQAVLSGGAAGSIEVVAHEGMLYAVGHDAAEAIRDRLLRRIAAHHARNPLDEKGMTVEELSGSAALPGDRQGEAFLRLMIGELERRGAVRRVHHTWALSGHAAAASEALSGQIAFVERFLARSGMQTPVMAELAAAGAREGIEDKRLKQILQHLAANGRAYLVENSCLHSAVVDGCRTKLLHALAAAPDGLTVAQFRDLVQGNRKTCLHLLAIYDAEGSTERRGDVRVLTEKGRGMIADGTSLPPGPSSSGQ